MSGKTTAKGLEWAVVLTAAGLAVGAWADTERVVRYSFTLQNNTGSLLTNGEFWVCAPVRETARWVAADLDVSHPYSLIEDERGNRILHFALGEMPPYAQRIVAIQAALHEREATGLREPLDRYLQPEPLLEIADPDFVARVPKVRSGSAVEKARQIFNWVIGYLRETPDRVENRGALYAMRNREGDCTEYACLFAAVCRYYGIPARVLGGYVTDRNTVLSPHAYHNWAEFHDGTRWRVADPQGRVFMENETAYVALRILGGSGDDPLRGYARYRCAGPGLTVRMNP